MARPIEGSPGSASPGEPGQSAAGSPAGGSGDGSRGTSSVRPRRKQARTPRSEPDVEAGPIRTCIGCRQRRSQAELTRVAICSDGALGLGRTLPGRGAWLCAGSSTCFDLAAGRQAFSRALHVEVSAEAIASLRHDFVRPTPAVRG